MSGENTERKNYSRGRSQYVRQGKVKTTEAMLQWLIFKKQSNEKAWMISEI